MDRPFSAARDCSRSVRRRSTRTEAGSSFGSWGTSSPRKALADLLGRLLVHAVEQTERDEAPLALREQHGFVEELLGRVAHRCRVYQGRRLKGSRGRREPGCPCAGAPGPPSQTRTKAPGRRGARQPRRTRSAARSITDPADSAPGPPRIRPIASFAIRAASTSPVASAARIPSARLARRAARGLAGFVRVSSASRPSAHLAAAVGALTPPPMCANPPEGFVTRTSSRGSIPGASTKKTR